MAERGQRTTLRFGSVSAEVSLLKTSSKPKSAEHETRRVVVPAEEIAAAERAAAEAMPVADPLAGDEDFLPPSREPDTDDFGGSPFVATEDDAAATLEDDLRGEFDHHGAGADRRAAEHFPAPPDLPSAIEHGRTLADPLEEDAIRHSLDTGARRDDAIPRPRPYVPYVAPVTRVEQGVHTEAGEWIDLTERLAEIDRRTKVNGMEVAATIAVNAIPRERVRDAHYIAGVDPDTFKVLALLWRGLRNADRAAAVRWTKRTAQTLGLIVARGQLDSRTNPAHLVLLEVEWAANMRKPAAKVTGPIRAEVAPDEIASAVELVEAFHAPPSAMHDLRDERNASRAELLQLARDGRLEEYVPPAEPMPEDLAEEGMDLAAALAAASAWVREHVPA